MASNDTRSRVNLILLRAGFGAAPADLETWAGRGEAATVDWLLQTPEQSEAIDPPDLKPQPFDPERLADQQAYFLRRLVQSRYPLVEQMVLFWHNHFATGHSKVNSGVLLARQNDLERKYALGNFGDLLREMAKDSAMLVWLDGNNSVKQAPNENYGREVMELFTLGIGNYSEDDVKAAARAFTGWRTFAAPKRPRLGEVEFRKSAWDGSVKSFLDQSGPWGADDINRILAGRPETATFISQKLWKWFASPTPDSATVAAMAKAYMSSGGELKPVLRTLLLSDAFFASAGQLVKTPAAYVAQGMRALRIDVGRPHVNALTRMGMELYNPPNVAGWPGGLTWLAAALLLARWSFGLTAIATLPKEPRPGDLIDGEPPAVVDGWLQRFGLYSVSPQTRSSLAKFLGSWPPDKPQRWNYTKALIHAIMVSPEYQVS